MIRRPRCPSCLAFARPIPGGLATVLVCEECQATWFSAPDPAPDPPSPKKTTQPQQISSAVRVVRSVPTRSIVDTIRGERRDPGRLIP